MHEGEYEELNEQTTKVFEFSAYCYMAALAFAVWTVYYAVNTPYLGTEDYVFFAVKVAVAAIVPGVVGFFGWLLFGKSSTAASIVYFLVFFGLAAHGYFGITAKGAEADRIAALAALPEPLSGAEIMALVAAGKPVTSENLWRKAPAPRPDTDDETLMASLELTSKTHLSRMNAAARKYFEAIGLLNIEEVIDGKRYIVKSQIDRQKISTDQYLTAIDEFRPVVEGALSKYEAALKELDLKDKGKEQIMAAYRSGAEAPTAVLLELCDTDRDRGEAVKEILQILEKDWGRWKYDRQRRKTVFESSQSQKLFDELSKLIETTARDKERLKARLGG